MSGSEEQERVGLAGVILAAGLGTRLRPLTRLRPKALCPVDGTPLVDWALARVDAVTDAVAVNAHHLSGQLQAHLPGGVHVAVEPDLLGTAGALGNLRDWIDGRDAVVVNGDAWTTIELASLVRGWDGERVRVLLAGSDRRPFGAGSVVAGCLVPWREVARLPAEPGGLYASVWAPMAARNRLDIVRADGLFVDCGSPARYLRANLLASGGRSVVGAGARVEGRLVRSVVWDGARVEPSEVLVDAVRADRGVTVLVRSPGGG